MKQWQKSTLTVSSLSPFIFPLLQAALVLLLLRELLWQEGRILSQSEEGDIFLQFYMMREFAVTHLLNGEFPFWNPHIFGGIPFFGGMQSALLYPLNAIYLLLPLSLALNWSIALHLWLMGLFTTLWLRYGLRLSHLAAGIGGIIAMFGGPFFMHIQGGHLSNLAVMIWTPLLLLAMQRWFDGGSRRWLALGAGAVTMQILGGHPQYLYYTGLTALMLLAWQLLFRSQQRGRDLLGITVIYLLGVMLGAIQLLPALEAASESVRAGGISFEFASAYALSPFYLASLLVPQLVALAPDKAQLWEHSLYIGMLGIFLVVVGSRYKAHPRNREFLLITLLLMVLALGNNTPLYSLLYHALPGFDLFRGSGKFAFFALLGVSALAAMGVDRLQQLPASLLGSYVPPLAVAAITLTIALLTLQLLAATSNLANPLFAHPVGMVTLAHDVSKAIAVLTLAALLLWFAARGLRPALLLLLLLLSAELYHNAANQLAWFDEADIGTHPVVSALQQLPGELRVDNPLYYNGAMLSGGYELWGNDPGLPKRWAEFIAHTAGFATPQNQLVAFPAEAPQLAIARLGWHLVATPQGIATTAAAEAPLPHAMLFYSAQALSREEVLQRLAAPSFDFRHTLLLETATPLTLDTPGSGEVKLISTTLNSLDLEVHSDAPAVLLVTDGYSAGWRAVEQSSGQEYRLLPADHAFIGIPLDRGNHRLHLEYRPRTLSAALLLSTLGLLAIVAMFGYRSPDRVKIATLP